MRMSIHSYIYGQYIYIYTHTHILLQVLRCVCWLLPELHETAESAEALTALQAMDYPLLSVPHKLALLRVLTERCLSVEVHPL